MHIKKVKLVTVFELYLHCFMVACVVGFSNLLFCDIWSWLSSQYDPLIVTVIVYGLPSIEVSAFSWEIIILSAHIILIG